MDYHTFKKSSKNKKGQTVYKWYYWYYKDGRQVQKACKGCKNRTEAENFIRALPKLSENGARVTVKEVAAVMYLPHSDHVARRSQLGKANETSGAIEARRYIKLIIEVWGDKLVSEINPTDVVKYLFKVERSGSWKNRYISIFGEIFKEAQWYGWRGNIPKFQTFARQVKKSRRVDYRRIKQAFCC